MDEPTTPSSEPIRIEPDRPSAEPETTPAAEAAVVAGAVAVGGTAVVGGAAAAAGAAANGSAAADTADLEPPPEEEQRRGGTIRFLVLLLLILIVAILLALRSCGGEQAGTTASSKRIAPVEGGTPVPGAVSVWIEKGAGREAALKGVASTEVVDLGNGRIVIEVPLGSEKKAVAVLRRNPGVYDAGLVYEDATPLKPGDVQVRTEPK